MPPRWEEPDPIRDRIRAWRLRTLAHLLLQLADQLDGWHHLHRDAPGPHFGRRLSRLRRALRELAADLHRAAAGLLSRD